MNIDKIKQRLATLKTATTKQNILWKPEPGKTSVRIVPYKYNPDNPFIELYFHFEIASKPMLSPFTYGEPDPIVEFSNQLKKTGSKDDWRLGKKLEPKLRTFVPIVVRGQENEGVKFWGFGKQVYEQLLTFISEPDYGDITSPDTGCDIVITFKTAKEVGKDYPETTIIVKRMSTPLAENKELRTKFLEEQKNIQDIYKKPTYDELKKALDVWLNPEESKDASETPEVNDESDEIKSNTDSDSADANQATFDQLFGKVAPQ